MEKIKLSILGTSNSIIASGYASALRNSDEIEIVKNVSIGSSHSVLAPLRIGMLENKKFDIMIIDLSVNETNAYNKGLYNFYITESIFKYILNWCFEKRSYQSSFYYQYLITRKMVIHQR